MWDLPGPGIESTSLRRQADSFPLSHQGGPTVCFHSEGARVMINLYSLSTCTYLQWDKSYQVSSVVQRKFKTVRFSRWVRTEDMHHANFSFFLSLFCVRNSPSASGGHLPQLQDCGPSLGNSSPNSDFLQLNPALPGEVPSSLDCREPQNESCRPSAFQLQAAVTARSHSLRTRSSAFCPSFTSEQSKVNGLSFFFTSPMTKVYQCL